MSIEQRPQVIRTADIVGMIKSNTSWVVDGKGQFNGAGRSPEEFVDPCVDHLISLQPRGERDAARAEYKARIAEIATPAEQLRFVSKIISGDWKRNMP